MLSFFPGKEKAGQISLKHVYEIAKIKINDPPNLGMTLEEMCKCVIGTAHSCGIEIVQKMDVEEYEKFLLRRKAKLEAHERKQQKIRQAKLLRL